MCPRTVWQSNIRAVEYTGNFLHSRFICHLRGIRQSLARPRRLSGAGRHAQATTKLVYHSDTHVLQSLAFGATLPVIYETGCQVRKNR